MVGGGVVRVLCNNIRALDSGIWMDSVFPSKSDQDKVVGWTRLLERGPNFCNHFINRAVTGVVVISSWWWGRKRVRGCVHCGILKSGDIRLGRNGVTGLSLGRNSVTDLSLGRGGQGCLECCG